jgi:hypothetical protein
MTLFLLVPRAAAAPRWRTERSFKRPIHVMRPAAPYMSSPSPQQAETWFRSALASFTVPELREFCEDFALPDDGLKAELVDRLVRANQEGHFSIEEYLWGHTVEGLRDLFR